MQNITQHQIARFARTYLVEVVFLCIALILGWFVTQLQLNMDDHVHIFPALLSQYLEHFLGYTRDYGLLRPLALLFFYFTYTLYLISPAVAHLVPFALHMVSGYLIYRILSKYTDISVSALLGILYIVFPFFTEQYAWLAASNATLANLMLILQLFIISHTQWTGKKKALVIAIFQLIGVLLYENIFFTGLAIAYFLSKQLGYKIRSSFFIMSSIIINLPSLLYFLTRTFVLKPTASSFMREMSGSKLLTEAGIVHVIGNAQSFLSTMSLIFTGEGVRNEYWVGNLLHGLGIISSSWITTLGFQYIIIGIIAFMWLYKNSQSKELYSPLSSSVSWLILAGLSLLPALLLSTIAFPFRVIALPIFMAMTALVLFGTKYSPRSTAMILAIITCGLLIITINILNNTRLVAQDDDVSFIRIVETINENHTGDDKVNVAIEDMPNSSRTIFDFGQYQASCVSSDWCLQAALNRRTGKVNSVIINQPGDSSQTSTDTFIFRYNQDSKTLDFVEQR